jgi:2-(1,2-epoxy-1,2-dihydrophenyl)acetyl-CoA isomerase
MSNFETLLLDQEGGVATLTLNRPDRRNAFNNTMSYELLDALKRLRKDDTVRVVVITGAGQGFCSGQDLKDSAQQGERSLGESLEQRYNPMIRALREMPKPVIARVNGGAVGAGCSLALACDLILAAEEAYFMEVFIQVGLVPDSGSSYFLARMLSPQVAFEWATMSPKIPAREAYQRGLINRCVPLEQLDQEVKKMTEYYRNAPTKAIALIKKMLAKGSVAPLSEMLDYEAYCQEIAGRSEDHQEGLAAFNQKRKPAFQGR